MGPATPPTDYKLVFQDEFRQLNWQAWRTGHPWGRNVHPDWQWKWWPHQSELTSHPVVYPTPDGLALELRKFSRDFSAAQLPPWQKKNAAEQWTAPYCMGCISSKQTYKFGWFEAEIKIPAGRGQWAAFWLSGSENWPPEIDIFEAYTTDDLNDIKIKPNIHWGNAGTWRNGKKDYGAPRIYVKNPHERFVHYACHWTEDFIRIYYDGHLVQECTNEEMLIQNSKPQYIILNHGLKKPKETNPIGSDMIVRNLKVYQNASK